ncbi:RNA-binding protein 28 [Chironomus tepperi]|uniref:RNA-binding protein 28 n=1 Tax=Chironomus tepperi TaxID=113505 RepID=UPI00391F4493
MDSDEKDSIKNESIEEEVEEVEPARKKKKVSREDDHEYTVFIKNLSFDTTNEDLKECFKKFGKINYALIVRDNVSGHSRGTGFVQFEKKESVEICLNQAGKIVLQDFTLDLMPALPKGKVKQIEKEKEAKKVEPKDSRNLYLLREGMIMAGSTASEGVSATDMAKRLRLEQLKSSMLKNLTRFISRDRLTIHNLPDSYDDAKLRKMVVAKTGSKPIECRVMRENKPTPTHPKGKSKGFGFLSFSRHEDALAVLRKLNNNPEIFSANHRPIVSFSIEDMNVLKIKERREIRSKLNNPTYQEKLKIKKLKRKENRKNKSENKPAIKGTRKAPKQVEENEDAFSGFASKPGSVPKHRGTFKLKEQSKIHEKSMKTQNKLRRRQKHELEVQQEKQEKKFDRSVKKSKISDKDSLVAKINKYKDLLKGSNDESTKKQKSKKWYVD